MAIVYRPPGVFTRIVFVPSIVRIAGAVRTPAIIGEASEELLIQNEAVTRNPETDADTLKQLFALEVIDVTDVFGRRYIEIVRDQYRNIVTPGDFDLIVDQNTGESKLDWSDGVNRPPSGFGDYHVTYRALKPITAYEPILFFDPRDVETVYGAVDIDDQDNIINPLTLGILLAFRAGASQVLGIQVKPSTPGQPATTQDWFDAIDKLRLQDVDIVIPLSTDPQIRSHTLAHDIFMSGELEKKPRFSIFAAPKGTPITDTDPSNPGLVQIANGLSNKRAILLAPTRYLIDLVDVETGTQRTVEVDGSFAAASISGTLVSQDVSEPLTRKQLVGFRDIVETFIEAQKNLLGANGITVIERRGGILRVRHGITTDTTSELTNEISVVQIVDAVRRILEDRLDRQFISVKITPGLPRSVEQFTGAVLSELKRAEVIFDYRGISARVSPESPSTILLSVSIRPIFPLNFIDITLTVSAA